MQINNSMQYEGREKNNNSTSLNSHQQKQGSQHHTPTNSQQNNLNKRADTFYSKKVMSFNDFQKHIQNMNYVNTTSQQMQIQSSRAVIEDKSKQTAHQQLTSKPNSQQNTPFQSTQDKYYGKQQINDTQPTEQKQQNSQYQYQQRNPRPLPIPPSSNNVQSEQGTRKKISQNHNQNFNNSISNTTNTSNTSNTNQKSKTLSELQLEHNYFKSQNRNISRGNEQQIPQSSSFSSITLSNNKLQNNSQPYDQQKQGNTLQSETQPQHQITNRWLFSQQQSNQNSRISNQNQVNNIFNGEKLELTPVNSQKNKEQQQVNPIMNQNTNQVTSQSHSFQNTPRDKAQPVQQNSKMNQLDFEGSHQQTQKNQVSQYTSKNTQFIKSKQQQTFQSILQQQQSQSLINNNTNTNGHYPITSEFNFPGETPKQQGFLQFACNNSKSNESLLNNNNIGTKRANEKPILIRHATPPDSSNRFKISSQNYMETPQCNFSSLLADKESTKYKLTRTNLNRQLILEGTLQEEEYNFNIQGDGKPQTFYNTGSRMTPSYQERRSRQIDERSDFENIINTSSSNIQINEERTPINKKKFQYKSHLNERVSSEEDEKYKKSKKQQSSQNKRNNGTENSLSVEEHVDDSILDEKISRSMFKANPSQHIQQKVQYECITVRCSHCQQDQQLQLKKILDNMKSSNSNNLFLNYFSRDNNTKNEVTEFNVGYQDQKKFNLSSSSCQMFPFQNNIHSVSSQDNDKISNQIKDLKEQLSHETTLNSLNEHIYDPNKTIKQLNCLVSANYLDLSKKSDNQRFSQSTSNINSIKLRQTNMQKHPNDNNNGDLQNQLHQINEQLNIKVKILQDNIMQKDSELEFQQQKMDDMNSQVKALTVKLQDIESKYAIDQQIIQTLETENRRLLENVTNILSLKLKLC